MYSIPKLPISRWAEDDKPREKLQSKGRQSLSNAELIAILIRSGTKDETAVELARRILEASGNQLNALARKSADELMAFNGIGPAKALAIITALEIGRRRKEEEPPEKVSVSESGAAFREFMPHFFDLEKEEFWVIYLDRSSSILKKERHSEGGSSGTVVDPRILFRTALEIKAHGMILAHNHPSGNLKPSGEDITLTRKVKDAGKLFHIKVLDHLIICQDQYFSFADQGLI